MDRVRATRRLAFTLVELLLVVMILGLLAALVVPRIAASGRFARANTCAANIALMNRKIELCAIENGGKYPTSHDVFKEVILKDTDHFPDGPPVCPYRAAYVYDPDTGRIQPHNHGSAADLVGNGF